ncbi:50S ribosomal protein L1 [Balneolaceae bacterium YR4-1]|uniref:Large ribosomal subunit protein uL1 n=1 Tax=Halalkalibaculum roseum TaxID=2709311 RepID=A0A6M1T5T1_9BACT|nr:50S ribosomal protein L1 [Halalkalibaculum roseum]NGP77345.1 50S ribosomal protein L1 [Halalkalibaculum roseum]
MAKRGKKYQEAAKLLDPDLEYTLEEACDLVKKTSTVKFDASVDMDLRLGVDPKHADQMVRGSVTLPHGTGKEVRVLALVNEAKQEEAKEAGADHVGLDEYINKIEEGWTDIDVIVATPDVMGKIGKLGRVLGPRGLMPNPKSGTVTNDVADAIKEVKAGKIDFRVDKYGILHASIGKTSFDASELRENALEFLRTVMRLRPASAKGLYIKSAYMSSTMGPSIELSRSSVISV